jgi:hypothetical protein
MPDKENEIISFVNTFEYIKSYFGENYLRRSISHYFKEK